MEPNEDILTQLAAIDKREERIKNGPELTLVL
jgi:hypothetical protein